MSRDVFDVGKTTGLMELAASVARDAGRVALGSFRKALRVDRKHGTELVTAVDFATEELIRRRLESAEPEIPILAEEEGGPRDARCYWCVDPIDGTTNYAHGHPFWAVSIGFVVDGEPIVGVVVAPALGIEWVARQDGPALRDGDVCRVSGADSIVDALLATGFPYDCHTNPDSNFDRFELVHRRAVGVRRCGSASLDLCFVADGTYDGYWEKGLRPWDLAAGVCIVRSAGGTVTSVSGDAIDLLAGNVVATNGRVHDVLVRLLSTSLPIP